MPEARNVRWAVPVTLPLALIGLGLSIYLTYLHFNHATTFAGCPATSHVNCLKVTTSSQSEIFGHIPVAVTGLIYYVVMVALVSPWAWRMANPWVWWARLAGAIGGVGMVCVPGVRRGGAAQGDLPVLHGRAHHHVLVVPGHFGGVPVATARPDRELSPTMGRESNKKRRADTAATAREKAAAARAEQQRADQRRRAMRDPQRGGRQSWSCWR